MATFFSYNALVSQRAAGYKNTAYALQYTSKELQNDKDIILQAVKETINALEYTSKKLLNDKDFIIDCIIINNNIFDHYEKNELII